MIAVVTGGRDYADVPRLWRWLDALHAKHGFSMLVDGASDDVTGPYVGWDYWSHQWALARNVPARRVHADWKQHGRRAGPLRNQDMLDRLLPEICIVGPGGNGTADMARRAEAAGLIMVRAA
jgi:hypothetical protein